MSTAPEQARNARRTRTDEDALDVYTAAADEELRRLDVQHEELDSMRQRTAQYLAFVGAATAFLAGSGLKSPDRDLIFYILASIGSAISLSTIVLSIGVLLGLQRIGSSDGQGKTLLPRPRKWSFLLEPGALLDAIDSDVPRPDKIDLAKYRAKLYAEMSSANSTGLTTARTVYVWALGLGGAQVVAWSALVWAKA